jgi:hypothetical protein
MSGKPKRLMVQVAETMQTRHYALSTQKTYRYSHVMDKSEFDVVSPIDCWGD